ncbi:ABC transporter family protein [Sedimentitalea todarodis]|uniref:ABC transmembrane type-1 domain-containing protein n=1 Tax=Sedimentitalea todarodis TaxID=1631240 RepID=A0ABU3VM28_9RHOB|nr:hypothetical protein [Sedimentitalea todarodis]MDU9006719.1 hypothetical protein [Sedimentitalea todarodis]
MSIAINILALALPLALLQVYDRILPNKSAGSALVIFSAVVVALILSGLLRYARSAIFARWSALEEYGLWVKVSRALITGNHERSEALLLSTVPAKARDANVGQTSLALYDAPFTVVFVLLIAYLGGVVVAAPLGVAVVVLLIVVVALPGYRKALRFSQSASAEFERNLNDVVGADNRAPGVSLLGRAFGRLTASRADVSRANAQIERVASLQMDLLQSGALITTVFVVWLGAGEVLSGQITTGGLAACTLLGSRAASQMMGIAATVLRTQPSRIAATQTDKALAAQAESNNPPVAAKHENLYSETSGIVILNGSPDLSADQELAQIVASVRNDVGIRVVPARPSLISASVISVVSRLDADLENEARELSGFLGLEQMVARLPHGFLTELTSPGRPLSDGATKRAALVQVLVGSPRVVLLEYPEIDLDVDGVQRLGDLLVTCSERMRIILTTNSKMLRSSINDPKVGLIDRSPDMAET